MSIIASLQANPTKLLSVHETARILRLSVDEVLILVFAGFLKSRWREQAIFIERHELQDFAFHIALTMDADQDFYQALKLLIQTIRAGLSDSEHAMPKRLPLSLDGLRKETLKEGWTRLRWQSPVSKAREQAKERPEIGLKDSADQTVLSLDQEVRKAAAEFDKDMRRPPKTPAAPLGFSNDRTSTVADTNLRTFEPNEGPGLANAKGFMQGASEEDFLAAKTFMDLGDAEEEDEPDGDFQSAKTFMDFGDDEDLDEEELELEDATKTFMNFGLDDSKLKFEAYSLNPQGQAFQDQDRVDFDELEEFEEPPGTVSQQDAESIIQRISTKKIAISQEELREIAATPSHGIAAPRSYKQEPKKKEAKAQSHRADDFDPATMFNGSGKRKAEPEKPSNQPVTNRQPSPKPKPKPRGGKAGRKTVEIEEIERRTTVRHFKQMYLQKNYPLFVIISQHKIKRIVSVLVDQVSSRKAFKIKKSNPIVQIKPVFPGCLCVPAMIDLDVTNPIAEAKFFLTPQALGKLEGARVEVHYEGKLVDQIDIDCWATTQAMAKLSGSMAAVMTTFGPTFKALGTDLHGRGAEWVGDLLTFMGSKNAPMLSSAIFGALTVLLYLWNLPKEGEPIENIFEYETAETQRL